MAKLFNGKIFSLYSQVALIDNEVLNSYPEWQTGEESVVYGPYGIAVATKGDFLINVIVSTEIVIGCHQHLVDVEIIVGK